MKQSPQAAALLVFVSATAVWHLLAVPITARLHAKGLWQAKPKTAPHEANKNALLWGEAVNGAKARIVIRPSWRFGQPVEGYVEGRIEATPVVGKWTIEVSDEFGKTVPVAAGTSDNLRFFAESGRFRFEPPEPFAEGRSWKPGMYILQATIKAEPDPFQPYSWHGSLLTRRVRIEIAQPDKRRALETDDPKFRKLFENWINDLDSLEPTARTEAEKNLSVFGLQSWPFVHSLAKASPRAMPHLEKVQKAIAKSVVDDWKLIGYSFSDTDFGDLEDYAWNSLQQFFEGIELTRVRVQRALVIAPWKLPEEKLLTLMDHADPDQRVLAIRSIGRTKNKATLAKLVKSLTDEYYEDTQSAFSISTIPMRLFPVATEARKAILWQGQDVIPLLIDAAGVHATQDSYSEPMVTILELLGALGRSDKSDLFLKLHVAGKNPYNRDAALDAFRAWGKDGVSVLLAKFRDEKENATYRAALIPYLCTYAAPKEFQADLLKAIRPETPDQLRWEAIQGVHRLGIRNILPDVKQIAMDEKTDHVLRNKAIDAVVGLAPKADVEILLVELMKPQAHQAVRCHAMIRAANSRLIGTLSKLLDGLDDKEYFIRYSADRALRLLANLPDGVGYDPTNPNTQLWRKWWDAKK